LRAVIAILPLSRHKRQDPALLPEPLLLELLRLLNCRWVIAYGLLSNHIAPYRCHAIFRYISLRLLLVIHVAIATALLVIAAIATFVIDAVSRYCRTSWLLLLFAIIAAIGDGCYTLLLPCRDCHQPPTLPDPCHISLSLHRYRQRCYIATITKIRAEADCYDCEIATVAGYFVMVCLLPPTLLVIVTSQLATSTLLAMPLRERLPLPLLQLPAFAGRLYGYIAGYC
jgi:hypothetical protein